MTVSDYRRLPLACLVLCVAIVTAGVTRGEPPVPVLETVFPAGSAAGQTVDVTIAGGNLNGLKTLLCNAPGFHCELFEPNRFHVTIPPDAPPGAYDLSAVCDNGLSAPRTFTISQRNELLEVEPNDSWQTAQSVPLNVVVNGRMEKGGDFDHFQFAAQRGQRVVIECQAERIDSRMRAVLEVLDAEGRRLAVNRGYFGIDPLIDFRVPADGAYVVKVQDLVSSGSAEHYYRLEIDTGPRVAFAVPCVIQRGQRTRVTLHGWNLPGAANHGSETASTSGEQTGVGSSDQSPALFDQVDVDIPETQARETWSLPAPFQPAQAVLDGFAYHLAGSHAPVIIGVTDVPVTLDRSDNHSPSSAQSISQPCEVSGQLVAGDDRDWFAIQAQRGEVLYIEAFGERIHSPVDLDVSLFDASGVQELARFSDELENAGGKFLPTSHLDPSGRWVAPADGRFLIMVRNLTGGLEADPRRVYRLSVRREEPDFRLVAVPHRDGPAALNIPRGGRAVLDVVAIRRRGLNGPIRITAHDLPSWIECPDVWLGPGVNRGTLVVTADRTAPLEVGTLQLEGSGELAEARAVRGGTIVRSGLPNGWGRLTSQIPFAVSADAPLKITADGHEPLEHHLYGKLQVRHSPGGIVDVAVHVERREADHLAPVKLTAIGLPDEIGNQTTIIPAGQQKGYISFYLPATLREGSYSLTIRAETTVPLPNEKKTEAVTVYSNPVTVDVQPAAFHVEVDRETPTRIKRGQIAQVNYLARRMHGFIGKIHTELAAPGRVTNIGGLRGRGVTSVGQVETGTIQVIANEDAPLGQQPFLRLYGVGVVEDQPIYHGSCFLNLEIVE